ncbi:MAG: hypothetical protein V2J62_07300 [candidate division KSB1 bacterium]|jgi:hypothetical protein|nr:hypothetical protein [candidate division KSB1 bacterium]
MRDELLPFYKELKPVYDTTLLEEKGSVDMDFIDHNSLNYSALDKIQRIREFLMRFEHRLN